MLAAHGAQDPLDDVTPVTDATEVRDMIDAVRRVYVAPSLHRYVVELVGATRTSPNVRLGASPRAGLHLVRASRANAALSGRDHVLPDDIQRLAPAVLAHRLLLSTDAHLARLTPDAVIADIVARVPVPAGP